MDASCLPARTRPADEQGRGPDAASAAASPRRELRLLVAAHFVYAGRVGGAEHMLYNLLRGLSQTCRQLTILCASERNLSAASLADLHRHDSVRIAEHGGGGPRFIAEQRACLTPGLSGDAVLFPNYFVPPITPRRLGRVATVLHDLQYRHFPQHFSTKKRAWLAAAQSFAVRKADRLIVISDFVRQDA
ncbi:MAG: hypothetical protein RQ966_18980, partial [Acetobacteraceae bacterium]|nr:hypothetical protein [Acetobacteraceae bacterium]